MYAYCFFIHGVKIYKNTKCTRGLFIDSQPIYLFFQEGEKRYSCQECVESYDLCDECHSTGKGEGHTREHGVYHDFILEQYSNITLRDFVSDQRLETCFKNAFQ